MTKGVALMIAVAGMVAAGCKREATPAPPVVAAPAAPPSGPAAPSAPAAPPAAAPPAGGDDPCPAICDRTRALKCKRAAACRDTCQEMRQVQSCGAEMAAVMTCFAHQPLSSWECSEDGDAAIKDGFCDKQQGQFVHCVEQAGGAHLPGTRAL